MEDGGRTMSLREREPLQAFNSRYGDFGPNHALMDSLVSRMRCPNPKCKALVFGYDPEDHYYLKCHKCGTRKVAPTNWPSYTPSDVIQLFQVRDGFNFLFGDQSSIKGTEAKAK